MISFFGIVHQDGGAGPELLGAIELLRGRNVPVRLITPPDDSAARNPSEYLTSLGVEVVPYTDGIFKTCPVLVSFAEGEKLFPLIRANKDRPGYLVYSDCMWFACDTEIDAYREGLIDELFFQTRRVADAIGPQIARRSKRSVSVRHGYMAYIHPNSTHLPIRFALDRTDQNFGVLKVARDHEEKWHPDTWRMFCGINAPFGTKVQIEVAGWGPAAAAKVSDIADPANRWHGQIDAQLHTHIDNGPDLAALYARSHVLVHVCDYQWEEAMSRVMLEAVLSGVVVISDARGGALDLIRHGETGYLVNSPEEAAYYASHLAFNPQTRKAIAGRAHAQLVTGTYANSDACFKWWRYLIAKFSAAAPAVHQPSTLNLPS